MKSYKLSAPDGSIYESQIPGQLGGYKPQRIYGRLDCRSALSHLNKGKYASHRVFFADEDAAIAAGFRPCAKCLPELYAKWKAGGECGSKDYPWLIQFKAPKDSVLLPSSHQWSEATERLSSEAMRVAYGGGVVEISAGARYFVDSLERVLVGWHGTYDPPCGMDGEPMIRPKKVI